MDDHCLEKVQVVNLTNLYLKLKIKGKILIGIFNDIGLILILVKGNQLNFSLFLK